MIKIMLMLLVLSFNVNATEICETPHYPRGQNCYEIDDESFEVNDGLVEFSVIEYTKGFDDGTIEGIQVLCDTRQIRTVSMNNKTFIENYRKDTNEFDKRVIDYVCGKELPQSIEDSN